MTSVPVPPSAAPDLLELLIAALPRVEDGLDNPCEKQSGHAAARALANRIRAAIAKAEGRAS